MTERHKKGKGDDHQGWRQSTVGKAEALTAEGLKDITTAEFFKGKKVVLFAVPGAFTPTCSAKHLPGFVEKAAEIRAKGVDIIACLSVNDAFVMGAWGKDQKADGKVTMLADGNGEFTKAWASRWMAAATASACARSAMPWWSQNGVVKTLNVEAPGAFEVSSNESRRRMPENSRLARCRR